MTIRAEMLATLLLEHIADAKAGHCLRVDDLSPTEADELRQAINHLLITRLEETPVKVLVLDQSNQEGRVNIEEAVALRNDVSSEAEAAILVLLVPPTFAREASSLDNAFERLPYATLLERAAQRVSDGIRSVRTDFPAKELYRLTRGRLAVEHWLEFLESVDEHQDQPFGRFLWQVGLIPDEGDDASAKARLRDNDAFVRKVIDPAGAGHAIEDRLRQTRLAPGPDFDEVLKELAAREDQLDDAREWTRAVAERVGLPFNKFELARTESDSDLDGLEVLPFRSPAGTVPKATGLTLVDDNLVCEIPDDGPGKVQVKWRTMPTQTKRVNRWLLRVVHPEDLREEGDSALVETRVAGARRSATIKLDFSSEDITGGFLFVVEVVPLDADGQPVETPESAITESEAFELVFRDAAQSPELTKSSSTAHSLGVARLRAVTKGASTLEDTHPVWDWNRHLFSLRIGGTRNVQIPANLIIATLQRQIIERPTITGYSADSPYGQPLEVKDFTYLEQEMPATLAKKRRQVMELLAAATPRDLPEVFPWTGEARATVFDYLQSYKRALDAAEDEALGMLQRLDTVELALGTRTINPCVVTVVLPIHPIRLAWLAGYENLTREWAGNLIDRGETVADRKDLIDFDGLTRLAPTNIPFAVTTAEAKLNIYFDELIFGAGLLLPIGHGSPEVLASTVSAVFNTPRYSASMSSDSAMISDRLIEYRKAHTSPRALRLASMHPGDGAVLADALGGFYRRAKDDNLRIEVVAYGDLDRYAQPLAPLADFQRNRQTNLSGIGAADGEIQPDAGPKTSPSPLFPAVGASLRPLDKIAVDAESIHLALAFGVSDLSASNTSSEALERFTSLDDLLCPTVTTNLPDIENTWAVSPALNPRSSADNATIVTAHRSHQAAVGKSLGLSGPPSIRVEVSGDTLDHIRVLHERSDWVLTLDRFVGLNFYESGTFRKGTTSYILDYAPDFIEGMSHRLTVTTSHRAEVSSILKHAMSDLGLDALEASSSQILNDLMTVSGRLILRLQSNEGFARESVSLAALVSHLRGQNKLDGAIIVPVDSHQEIFGRNAPGNETGRRCDMLIVRLSQRKFSIQCVEVKSRRSAALPTELADSIADQLEATRDLLEQRYFASDPPRIDGALQRAQLAGLLHYYADRAVTNGLIPADKVALTHKHIDSLVEGGVDVEISMRGYVISLTGAEGIPAEHRGIPISVLTASDLGKLGFSVAASAGVSHEGGSEMSSASEEPQPEETSGVSDKPEDSLPDIGITSARDNSASAEAEPSIQDTSFGSNADTAEPNANPEPSSHDEPVSEPKERTTTGQPTGSRDVTVAIGKDSAGAVVNWKPSTKGSPHAFIVGIPGQGKSVTTRRLIQEMADHGLPSLVIDFHGDMAANPPANAEVLDAAKGLPFTPFETLPAGQIARINQAAWELAEVIQFVGSMGEIQRSNVYKALQDAYAAAISESRAPTLTEFAAALEEVESRARGARNARERVRPLTDFGLFDESASRSFNPRQAGMVVDLSNLMLEEVQIAATSFLLRQIYRDMFSWPQDGTLKLAIVLDEAHRVANDVTLPKLMKEGRKYGVVVVVASQGLSDFHRDVLGNAGMKIVFRTNHPESKAVARYLRGRAGQDLSVEIEKLGVGQAYVATADMPQARKTQMFE